jgi:CheY-like chemotaxis protein/GAF domain-containing protein
VATILIVDDDAINRKLLVSLLSHYGYLTFEARDGLDGLKMAHLHRPQLIISDIVMPSMDGFGFVRALRADPVLHATRVIFYTAIYHEREAARLAQACHVARVLVKPCAPTEILATVKQTLAGIQSPSFTGLSEEFDRKHLLLVSNKLSEKSAALEASNARLMALMELDTSLMSDRDPPLLLERVCAGARKLLGCRYAVLAVMEDTSNRTRHFASSGIDFSDGRPPPPTLSPGPLSNVVSHMRPWRAHSIDGAPVNAGLPPAYPPATAFLAVPLVTKTRALGWLCLADKIGADIFDLDDERFLSGLGAMAGRLYENCSLQADRLEHMDVLRNQDDKFRELIDEHATHLDRLHTVMSGLIKLAAQAPSMPSLYEAICRLLVAQCGCGLAFIAAADPESGELGSVAVAGDEASLPRAPSREAGSLNFLLASVMDSLQPVICNELKNASEYLAFHQILFRKGYRALAVMPVASGNAAIGCLVVAARQPDSFSPKETRLVTIVAEAISLGYARIARETSPA